MSNIHNTAIIETGAHIGSNVNIGPYCVVGKNVTLRDNVTLKSHVVVEGDTKVGKNTIIYPFASIGHAPQDLKFSGEKSELIIGENNIIREYVTMNPGTAGDIMKTIVGDNCLFMMSSHVAHDCIVGNNVILANNATLGGHVKVGDFVIIGGLSAVHQFVSIGDYAMIGGMSGISKNVPPYSMIVPEYPFIEGLNLVGLKRKGFSKDEIRDISKAYELLFDVSRTINESIQEIEKTFQGSKAIERMLSFLKAESTRGLTTPRHYHDKVKS